MVRKFQCWRGQTLSSSMDSPYIGSVMRRFHILFVLACKVYWTNDQVTGHLVLLPCVCDIDYQQHNDLTMLSINKEYDPPRKTAVTPLLMCSSHCSISLSETLLYAPSLHMELIMRHIILPSESYPHCLKMPLYINHKTGSFLDKLAKQAPSCTKRE